MGFKEDIERLQRERLVRISQEERDAAERQRQAERERFEAENAKGRAEDTRRANNFLGAEIASEIFTPRITELRDLLNANKLTSDEFWNLVKIDVLHRWSEDHSSRGEEDPRMVSYEKEYRGIALVKKRNAYKERGEKISFFGNRHIGNIQFINYYMIFAGRVDSSLGVVSFCLGEREDNRPIVPSIGRPVYTLTPETTLITIPRTTPEALAEDLDKVRDPGSSLSVSINSQLEQCVKYPFL